MTYYRFRTSVGGFGPYVHPNSFAHFDALYQNNPNARYRLAGKGNTIYYLETIVISGTPSVEFFNHNILSYEQFADATTANSAPPKPIYKLTPCAGVSSSVRYTDLDLDDELGDIIKQNSTLNCYAVSLENATVTILTLPLLMTFLSQGYTVYNDCVECSTNIYRLEACSGLFADLYTKEPLLQYSDINVAITLNQYSGCWKVYLDNTYNGATEVITAKQAYIPSGANTDCQVCVIESAKCAKLTECGTETPQILYACSIPQSLDGFSIIVDPLGDTGNPENYKAFLVEHITDAGLCSSCNSYSFDATVAYPGCPPIVGYKLSLCNSEDEEDPVYFTDTSSFTYSENRIYKLEDIDSGSDGDFTDNSAFCFKAEALLTFPPDVDIIKIKPRFDNNNSTGYAIYYDCEQCLAKCIPFRATLEKECCLPVGKDTRIDIAISPIEFPTTLTAVVTNIETNNVREFAYSILTPSSITNGKVTLTFSVEQEGHHLVEINVNNCGNKTNLHFNACCDSAITKEECHNYSLTKSCAPFCQQHKVEIVDVNGKIVIDKDWERFENIINSNNNDCFEFDYTFADIFESFTITAVLNNVIVNSVVYNRTDNIPFYIVLEGMLRNISSNIDVAHYFNDEESAVTQEDSFAVYNSKVRKGHFILCYNDHKNHKLPFKVEFNNLVFKV